MGEPVQSKFGPAAIQHTHPDVPKVFVQPDPPTQGMVRGDIWIKTVRTDQTKTQPAG